MVMISNMILSVMCNSNGMLAVVKIEWRACLVDLKLMIGKGLKLLINS